MFFLLDSITVTIVNEPPRFFHYGSGLLAAEFLVGLDSLGYSLLNKEVLLPPSSVQSEL